MIILYYSPNIDKFLLYRVPLVSRSDTLKAIANQKRISLPYMSHCYHWNTQIVKAVNLYIFNNMNLAIRIETALSKLPNKQTIVLSTLPKTYPELFI